MYVDGEYVGWYSCRNIFSIYLSKLANFNLELIQHVNKNGGGKNCEELVISKRLSVGHACHHEGRILYPEKKGEMYFSLLLPLFLKEKTHNKRRYDDLIRLWPGSSCFYMLCSTSVRLRIDRRLGRKWSSDASVAVAVVGQPRDVARLTWAHTVRASFGLLFPSPFLFQI